ncbi:hypothetical protein GJ496_004337 [Pomphorhynchus laevis]|nr:hypothetical protein GJ496_004337 [Pomphorhynchus laevis]
MFPTSHKALITRMETQLSNSVSSPWGTFASFRTDIVDSCPFYLELKHIVCWTVTFSLLETNVPVDKVQVPVVAGHSGDTIVPLLSQVVPKCSFTEKERDVLAGAGSATLSMAFEASRFVQPILKAKFGETGIVECALSEESYVRQEPRFFSRPHLLGLNGI